MFIKIYVTNFLIILKTYFNLIEESFDEVSLIVEISIVGVEVATGLICNNKLINFNNIYIFFNI